MITNIGKSYYEIDDNMSGWASAFNVSEHGRLNVNKQPFEFIAEDQGVFDLNGVPVHEKSGFRRVIRFFHTEKEAILYYNEKITEYQELFINKIEKTKEVIDKIEKLKINE